jgi:uncharacterized protein
LRSLDRLLGQAWKATDATLFHVISYSDPKAERREVRGLLDDYAFTVLACLDAYEATRDLSYFTFARSIADSMIRRFFDATSGGFLDSEPSESNNFGVLATRRKPLQDSPTPAGNPMAAIALIRIHHYTDEASYRDKAEQTLETFAGVAEQFGIFAATFGIAVAHFLGSPVQVVVIEGDDIAADELRSAATERFAFSKMTLQFKASQVIAQNLPPILANTIPNLPQVRSGKSFAVICSGSTCQPPVFSAEELRKTLGKALHLSR